MFCIWQFNMIATRHIWLLLSTGLNKLQNTKIFKFYFFLKKWLTTPRSGKNSNWYYSSKVPQWMKLKLTEWISNSYFKNKTKDANSKMTKILKLSNRGFKTVIIKSFSEPLKTLLKQMERYRKSQKLDRRYKEPTGNFRKLWKIK